VAAAAAGALLAAHRSRVSHLLQLERMRLRIASDLHDDVGSSLSSIALLSEMLQSADPARLDERERRQLDRIHRAAEETVRALRDIIWLVDPTHADLADLVGRMRGVAGDLLNGTTWTFDVDGTDGSPPAPRPLGMPFMRNVLLIYKEALHNITKHAGARRVVVAVGARRGEFVLRIEDDGVGFDEDVVRRGRGLESMRRRAEQTGGRLDIASAPGAGTRVTYTAPIARTVVA
jgi:signal transduction histidine kinase